MTDISKYDDIIDSRNVIARIDELESEIDDLKEQLTELEDDEEEDNEMEIAEISDMLEELEGELDPLKALAEDASCYNADWRFGETLIRDSYFKEYTMDMAEDIGAIGQKVSWPLDCIDWDQAADALKQDYTSVDFDGEEFWIRSC
jgi:hypothetical protein